MERLIKLLLTDKATHFLVCYWVASMVRKVAPRWVAAIVGLLAGVIKEIYDVKKGGVFDVKDLIADAAGVLMAIL